jgi:hypothetical protein
MALNHAKNWASTGSVFVPISFVARFSVLEKGKTKRRHRMLAARVGVNLALIHYGRRSLLEKNRMRDRPCERAANTPGSGSDPLPNGKPEPRARQNRTALWHSGVLFHCSTRYPRNPRLAGVDRLAGILRNGLLAPASCKDGSVCSDLHLVVTGTDLPYDRLVFLHRFGPQSYIYTPDGPGRFVVFVEPAILVLTPEAMGANWVVLCQDEVYVQDRIAPEHLNRVAVHREDAESVRSDLMADFQRLGIPLYDFDGNVLWQPARPENRLGSR